jgi:hypothetical protein
MISKIFPSLSEDLILIIEQYTGFFNCDCDCEYWNTYWNKCESCGWIYSSINCYIDDARYNDYRYYFLVFRNVSFEIMFPETKRQFEQKHKLNYDNKQLLKVKYFETKVPGTTVDSIDPDGNFFMLRWNGLESERRRKEFYQTRKKNE